MNRAGLMFFALAFSFASDAFAQSLVLVGKNGWLFAGWESLSDENKDGIDRTSRLIGEVRDVLNADKIKLYVLVVPMKALIYPENLPAEEVASEEIKKRYTYILSNLAHEHVATVDLRPVLIEIKNHHLAFYRTDYHWTPWSAEACADAAAKLMGFGSGSSGIVTDAKTWRVEKRFGDLANFLSRERRNKIGEEQFTVRANAAEGGLLDNAEPKLQVVGNSFVQPYLGFTQALSSRLGFAVGLSWNYGNVGPWVTLRQYLQSEAFKKTRPEMIVWQWNEAQFANGPDAAGQWAKESITVPSVWLNQIKAAVAR